VVQCEVARARREYEAGWPLIEGLTGGSRRMFSMMWRTYRTLLEQIAADPWQAYQRRVRLPTYRLAWIAASHFCPPLYYCLRQPIRGHREAVAFPGRRQGA
jgi:phytoene synthase